MGSTGAKGNQMAKTDRSVRELVSMVEKGELQLPEMQREYVWRATRVRDLLDSLYRGYPSGVILAWESDESVATTKFAVETNNKSAIKPLLLLDGQQRLTSLSAVLRGEPVDVRGRKRPVDILFNLDHPAELTYVTEVHEENDEDEEAAESGDSSEQDIQERLNRRTFVVASKSIESLPNWVKVSDVFSKSDSELLRNSGVTGFDDPRYELYSERLQNVRAIAQYEYRMDILEATKSYEEVTEIFVRVNSLGAKLKSSDLALAQITAKWRGSLELFRAFQDHLNKRGFDLEMGVILKALVSIITGQSKFLTVGSISQQKLEKGWDDTQRALNFAVNFMSENLGIDSPTVLSSPFTFITAAYWASKREYKIPEEEAKAFGKWLLIANAKGRYSRGSSETLLDQDLLAVRKGGVDELNARLTQQMGRLNFTVDDIVGRTSRSGVFKTMFLAFRQDKAKDWTTSLEISPKHQGKSDSIEYHHIFPKAFLKRERPGMEIRLVDDIANLAFIGARTNKAISDKAPSQYRHEFDQKQMKLQQIDFENGLDNQDRFEDFLIQRRQAIVTRINRFLELQD